MMHISENDLRKIRGRGPAPRPVPLFGALPGQESPRIKTRKKKMTQESRVLRTCLAWLKARGVFAWRNNTGAYKSEAGAYIRYGYPGSSDIFAVQKRTGKLICIECKAGGELNENQRRFRNVIREQGAIYMVVRSIDDLERQKREILP